MTLEEEKKLVAEWMGLDIIDSLHIKYATGPYKGQYYRDGQEWNPQSNDCPFSVWQEIWANLNIEEKNDFMDSLEKTLVHPEADHYCRLDLWNFHTAKPETSWAALVKTLKEGSDGKM